MPARVNNAACYTLVIALCRITLNMVVLRGGLVIRQDMVLSRLKAVSLPTKINCKQLGGHGMSCGNPYVPGNVTSSPCSSNQSSPSASQNSPSVRVCIAHSTSGCDVRGAL